MKALVPALAYFACVFGAGFALGPVRVLWLAPQVGERAAELLEMPVMFGVILLAARWVVRRFRLAGDARAAVMAGVLALALMLAAEFSLVLWLRGQAVADYVAARDPVSGGVYALLLAAYAAMPALAGRRRPAATSSPPASR